MYLKRSNVRLPMIEADKMKQKSPVISDIVVQKQKACLPGITRSPAALITRASVTSRSCSIRLTKSLTSMQNNFYLKTITVQSLFVKLIM